MSKELIVSSTRHETKVAILEDDEVAEVYFEREQEYSLAGSVYKGRVTRVLPGMQSAFVDIGLERDAFLYVSDFFEDTEEYDKVVTLTEEKVAKMEQEGVALSSPPAPAAPVPGPAVELPEPAPEAAVESSPLPAEREAAERADEGRRRRRSRRRRGRGKGFPEAKYAGAPAGAPEPKAPAAVPSPPPAPPAEEYGPVALPLVPGRAPVVPPLVRAPLVLPPGPGQRQRRGEGAPRAEEYRPVVLPGESLAKYRDRQPPAAPVPEPVSEPERGAEHSGEPAWQPQAEVHAAAETAEPTPSLTLGEAAAEQEQPAAESAWPAVEAVAEWQPPAPEGAPPVAKTAAEDDQAETPREEPFAEPAGPLEAEAEAEPELSAEEAVPPVAEASVRESPKLPRYPDQRRRRMRRKMLKEQQGQKRAAAPESAAPRSANGARPTRSQPLIAELLSEGQEIIVQIAKEPMGKKGARITSHIALPGRYLVYMPTVDHIGVSRRIASEEERHRLKRLLSDYRRSANMPGGFIVRTAGEGHSDADLRADMQFLFNLWKQIRAQAERCSAPALLHRDLNLVERILRDQLSDSFSTIWVDNELEYAKILEFVEHFQPSLVGRVKLYLKDTPIFEEFGVEEEINKSLKPKVWLKSGGYIVINQTEALVAIDVNTGKFVGRTQRLEDTIVKTNVDAIREIVRQIRLRDLGGIIVIDFIDMDERKNRQRVMQALEEALRRDRAPSKALAFNDFGLVAITRKRIKQPLERTLGCSCPYCGGAGFVKNPQTLSMEILTEAKKILPHLEGREITLRVNPELARYLKQPDVSVVSEIEEMAKKTVIIKSDPSLHQENFDIH